MCWFHPLHPPWFLGGGGSNPEPTIHLACHQRRFGNRQKSQATRQTEDDRCQHGCVDEEQGLGWTLQNQNGNQAWPQSNRKTFFPSHLLGFRSVYLHDSPVLGAFLARTPQKSGLSQKKGYPNSKGLSSFISPLKQPKHSGHTSTRIYHGTPPVAPPNSIPSSKLPQAPQIRHAQRHGPQRHQQQQPRHRRQGQQLLQDYESLGNSSFEARKSD